MKFLKTIFTGNAGSVERTNNEPMSGGRRKGEASNPYLTGRRSWNDHVGGVVQSRQMFMVMGVLALCIALAAVGGVVHIGSQSKFIPFIVEVDKLGQSMAYAPANRASPVPPIAMAAAAAAFVADARLVTLDVDLQRKAVYRTYAMLQPNTPGINKMNEWMNGSPDANPFARAQKEMVSIEINTALPQSATTYQVDWVETTRDRQGVLVSQVRMRGLFTLSVVPPTQKTKEEQMRMNALGIFVRDFSWSRQL